MKTQQLDQQIRTRIDTFLQELAQLVRQSAVEAVRDALGAGSTAPAAPRRGPGRPRKSGTPSPIETAAPKARAGRKGKRGKRSTEAVGEMAEKLFNYIAANAGQSIEEIGKGLGVATKELKLPIKKLLGGKRIKTTGQRRGTRYSAK